MSGKWNIIDEEFVGYNSGDAFLISNGNYEFYIWEDKKKVQEICNKLNGLVEENKQSKMMIATLRNIVLEQEDLEKENTKHEKLPIDRNGYNKIVCPVCGSDLKYSRFIGYMNGEQYEEFDCTECDFVGRIRKGNVYD